MVDVSSSRRRRSWAGLAAAIAIAGLAASCNTWSSSPAPSATSGSASSSSGYFDSFRSKPASTVMLIESNPAGAQAKTSFGKSCTTPCTMLIGETGDFTVTFTLSGYVSQTLPVHPAIKSGGWTEGPSLMFEPPSLFPTLERDATPPPAARKPGKPRA
jgi:hypothetical protein